MKLPTLFNPSNDMALAANVRQYFPPKRIQQMEEDLAPLSKYWDEGPWGWSHTTKLRYMKMGISEEYLPADEYLDCLRALSSREFAAGYIKALLQNLDSPILVGNDMVFMRESIWKVENTESQKKHIEVQSKNGEDQKKHFEVQKDTFQKSRPLIFKSPWSSSGRGVFTSVGLTDEQIEHKVSGFLNTQGGYLMDTFYEKSVDFAMEFFIHPNGATEFLGYSVFQASENGAYGFNYVESQEKLKQRIGVDNEVLAVLEDYHRKHLGSALRPYTGPVGIDMIKCKDGSIHPCIEINLRMNMGILAINLFERFGAKANVQLTPRREHGFEGKIEDGKLMLCYSK